MELEGPPSVLSTPIRKIRNLNLNSPSTSPLQNLRAKSPLSSVRYPSLSDLPSDPIFSSMVDRGYSQTISNTVLRELDSRANEISSKVVPKPLTNKKKRYSGVHRPLFAKMESISAHYAASRSASGLLPHKDYMGSATKKRRTLNGPEEIFGALARENDSPVRLKADSGPPDQEMELDKPFLEPASLLAASLTPHLAPVSKLSPESKLASASPFLSNKHGSNPYQLNSSPVRSSSTSPTRSNKISPSKGSMNLNGLLNDNTVFAKPAPPQKIRQSSLQMAGVVSSPHKESSIPVIQRGVPGTSFLSRSSIPSLQKKLSIPSLQKKQSSLSLQKSSSIPALQKKPSIPSLHKKPSIPALQKKPSVSTLPKPSGPLHKSVLQKKLSLASLTKNSTNSYMAPTHQPSQTLQKKPSIPSIQSASFKKPLGPLHHVPAKSIPSTQSPQSIRTASSLSTVNSSKEPSVYASTAPGLLPHFSPSSYLEKQTSASHRPNVTIPKPFSLYERPTLSSSQKSLQSLSSTRTLEDMRSASQRSLNRFQRFKNRFS